MYKPPKVKSGGALYGTAKVLTQRDPNGKVMAVRAVMLDDEGNKTTDVYDFKAGNFPEYAQAGTFKVSIYKDTLQSLSPVEGQYVGKLLKFSAQKDKPPAPKVFQGKNWDYEYFTVMLVVTRGAQKGMVISYNLRYNFEAAVDDKTQKPILDKDGDQVVGYGHLKSKYTPILEEFCDITGVWQFGSMKYKDNILSSLEKRALRAGKEFNIVMRDGWVDKLFPLMETVEKEANSDNDGNFDPDPDDLNFTPEAEDLDWEQVTE